MILVPMIHESPRKGAQQQPPADWKNSGRFPVAGDKGPRHSRYTWLIERLSPFATGSYATKPPPIPSSRPPPPRGHTIGHLCRPFPDTSLALFAVLGLALVSRLGCCPVVGQLLEPIRVRLLPPVHHPLHHHALGLSDGLGGQGRAILKQIAHDLARAPLHGVFAALQGGVNVPLVLVECLDDEVVEDPHCTLKVPMHQPQEEKDLGLVVERKPPH
mmetsp:Transcript_36163/g.84707  ORF Transcript_36163/g.84707 Transcript_36163/m.84707 type:complete len:216 (-) Transcript_36163:308-955(-)